jgi:hypothetical protein
MAIQPEMGSCWKRDQEESWRICCSLIRAISSKAWSAATRPEGQAANSRGERECESKRNISQNEAGRHHKMGSE